MKNFEKQDFYRDISQKIIRSARDAGADNAAVEIESGFDSLARFSRNQIIQNMEQVKDHITLALDVDTREAAVTLDRIPLDDQEIRTFTTEAVNAAKKFHKNPEHTEPLPPQTYEKVNCVDEKTLLYSHQDKALKIQEICKKTAQKNLFAFGTFRTAKRYKLVANSNGLFVDHPETNADFTLTVRTKDGKGSCREIRSNHAVSKLQIDECVQKTIEWTEQSKNPRNINPQDYTVILTPTAALNYLMFGFWAFDARKVEEYRSPLAHLFKDKNILGDQLFSSSINVKSVSANPVHPEQHFSQAMSMDGMLGQGMTGTIYSMGLPVKTFPIIHDGRIKNLFYSYYWAKHKGIEPMGFPKLLEFAGSNKSLKELIAETSEGLLINSFWYIRFVDPTTLLLTGLTRDGAFKIENGEIAYPVKNLRFNESPLYSLSQVTDVGIPEKRRAWNNTVLIPPMKIENFTFSSETDAI